MWYDFLDYYLILQQEDYMGCLYKRDPFGHRTKINTFKLS
jgi:hypothetical protein